uniref:uncharacterized protein LOC101293653 n=1 Tax=Fragaria vesca subsp. vesca TaxID=101020 RepID=UPI0005CADFA6|nr:PREDICTED: uncharacterized protein LOC101293653 [Fragaria vesca subsp. vesca]
MSNTGPKPKRLKKITGWFQRTNVSSSSSNSISNPSISSPNIDHPPQPSESPNIDDPPQSVEPPNRVNALERDLGLLSSIWKYPVNERDSVRKAYILLGPFQPELVFPLSEHGDQQRRFQYSWFKNNPWLEYSIALDKAYCFPCFLFDTENSKNHTFTVEGFRNWKRDLLRNPKKHIETILESRSLKDVEDNRLRLKAAIEAARLLANQGAPFRGHDESEDSLNQGYFKEVIKSFSRMSVEVERVVLGNAPRNAMYTSPRIQKELLNILGNKVRGKIRDEVGNSKYCILVDEAVDSSSQEQMAIILRFVDSQGLIRERFFKIVSVPNTTSQTLKNEISKVLTMYNLQVRNMRGQGYDGASNMRAQGVHDIWEFFSTLSFIVNFLDSSAKRHSALKEVRKEEIANLVACGELQTGNCKDKLSVESFCEKHDLDMPNMNASYKDGMGRACQQMNFITFEHHYRIEVFNVVIDFQLSELNRRFLEEASQLLILSSTLDPHDNFRNFKCEDVCNLAKQFYPENFDDGEMYALESECAFYEIDMRNDPKFKNMKSISDLCHTLVQTRKSEFFPMLYRLICLVLTIHVSTATTERAFSAMNIIKNKLRSKMGDEYLGDCMVLHIEKAYAESVTNEEVIKEFEASSTRRVSFS